MSPPAEHNICVQHRTPEESTYGTVWVAVTRGSALQQQNYLQGLVVSLQLSTQPLQFAAGQHGPAVLALQLILLLHHLEKLLLQDLQLLLVAPVLLQLPKHDTSITIHK